MSPRAPVVPALKYLSGSLPPENPGGFSRRTGLAGLSRDWTSNQVVFRWPNYDMQYRSKNLITKLESDFVKLELSKMYVPHLDGIS